MNTLRKQRARHYGLAAVAYGDEVTEEHTRIIDDLVREEFEHGDWVTVEQES